MLMETYDILPKEYIKEFGLIPMDMELLQKFSMKVRPPESLTSTLDRDPLSDPFYYSNGAVGKYN